MFWRNIRSDCVCGYALENLALLERIGLSLAGV